ncbi:hypothetical protein J6590_060160 [Homalodisca vitripennis]|nr:hypothetical protein J6590_060160 [Homalodisca vitripennis]
MLDFSQALHSIDYSMLMAKMHFYGFSENTIEWMRSYLHTRLGIGSETSTPLSKHALSDRDVIVRIGGECLAVGDKMKTLGVVLHNNLTFSVTNVIQRVLGRLSGLIDHAVFLLMETASKRTMEGFKEYKTQSSVLYSV